MVCPLLLAAAGVCRGRAPPAANARSVHQRTARREEYGPDQVQACARISAELARAHRGEHMPALCSALAEGGQTIPDLA